MRVTCTGIRGALLLIAAGVACAQVNTSGSSPVKDQATSGTGSAVPASAAYMGGNSSGNLTGLAVCDGSALLSLATAVTTQIVALVSGKSIYICGFVMNAGGTTTIRLVQGTGANCATGQGNLTPAFNMIAGGALAFGSSVGAVVKTSVGNALCVTNSAAQTANVLVSYTQF